MLNATAKRYRVQPYPEAAAASPAPPTPDPQMAQMTAMGMPPPSAPARGGGVTITTTLSDTLERQQLFGLEARHVKTTIVKQADGKACDKSPFKVEMDAWYVDLPEQSACTRPAAPPPPPAPCASCTDTHLRK